MQSRANERGRSMSIFMDPISQTKNLDVQKRLLQALNLNALCKNKRSSTSSRMKSKMFRSLQRLLWQTYHSMKSTIIFHAQENTTHAKHSFKRGYPKDVWKALLFLSWNVCSWKVPLDSVQSHFCRNFKLKASFQAGSVAGQWFRS